MIRVVVADDHPVVRAGLVALLGDVDDIEVVGQAGDGLEAVDAVRRTGPDVVLMDLRMPGLNGVDATRQITASAHPPAILILTTYESDDAITAAIEAGATGYLLKAAPEEEIFAAIRATSQGAQVMSPNVAAALARSSGPAGEGLLSSREGEVLRLVAGGLSNREIAARLYLSPSTIKTHLEHILTKLNASDRTHAVSRAHTLGLLDRPNSAAWSSSGDREGRSPSEPAE